MATTSVDPVPIGSAAKGRTIGIRRLTIAGGASAALVFILCWAGTFVPFSSPTHAYIRLFTEAPLSSVDALAEGALWSLLFGALTGAVFGSVYNLLVSLDRR